MARNKKTRPARVAWGTGRVVVLANLSAIQNMLDEGWPLTMMYSHLKDSLAGLSYRQFSEQVRIYCNRAVAVTPSAKGIVLLETTGHSARCS